MQNHLNPQQWIQAVGYARQVCARFFRDGGSPADALRAYGIAGLDVGPADWGRAVDAIAAALCARPQARAA